MKKVILGMLVLCCSSMSFAENNTKNDTLYTELKNDVIVLSSTKETNSLKSLPAAVSFLSQKNLESRQITSLKEVSAFVPNFFISDYGSKYTAPIYIRGIGARTGTQTAGVYVDNIPYFNTASFDTELYDIQRIEVLRGTQSTLYGRNAMGGAVNIYTYSPLTYEGKIASVTGGSHGLFSAQLSHHKRITNKFGFSTSLYYKRNDGFFKNKFDGEKADEMESAGGRIKLVWDIRPDLQMYLVSAFDFSNQAAFPYMGIDSTDVNFDGRSSYIRRLSTNGLNIQYTNEKFILNSTSSFQYLNDNMWIDNDFTPLSIFGLNQRQKDRTFSEEITIKSNTDSNYKWSFGVFGFMNKLKLTSPVYMYADGIETLIRPNFDYINNNPNIPVNVDVTDEQLDMNSDFTQKTSGVAVFHQSTYNNLFDVKGLSVTGGLRLDYDKTQLDYNSNSVANLKATSKTNPYIPTTYYVADTAIVGIAKDDYLELLPKALIKYEFNKDGYVYASASRGYKSGGHNIQMFADLLSDALTLSMKNVTGMAASEPGMDVNDRIRFKSEYSWNYEVGGQTIFFDNSLSVNYALYYMDVRDVQISQFVSSGQGRVTVNAGKAESKGFELGLKARPCKGFYLYANYGFSDAKFKDYAVDSVTNYAGNHIPFAPQQTLSIGTSVNYEMKNKEVIDEIFLDANYAGAGKIYWTEANDITQPFYGTVNARLGFNKKAFTLEFWGKNLFDSNYNAFYFESMGKSFVQQGKPFQFGATLKVKL